MKKFLTVHLPLVLVMLMARTVFAQDEMVNLGTNVNTEYDELAPYISPDGKTLFFVREGHPMNNLVSDYDDAQDIWYSELQSDGSWGAAQHMSYPFNQRKYNFVNCMSPDGNVLYINGAYEKGVYVSRGISRSNRTANGWSLPEKIVVEDLSEMNRGKYSGAYLSNDGKVLLLQFSEIDRDDNSDLYVSFLTDDNVWSRPKKIPDPVSTEYGDEISPFLASDGMTMYFATQKDDGYGSYDIYMTKRLDDTWLNWTEPKNLGPLVNTARFEGYFALDAKGETAYIVSSSNSYGKGDVFSLKLPADMRPSPVVMIYGSVYNSKSKQPIEASVDFSNLADGEQLGIAQSNPSNGSYKIVLPVGKKYAFSAYGQGYYSVSDNIDLTKETGYREIKRDLYLSPLDVGANIRLNNIFFDPGKSSLSPESGFELDKIVKLMKDNPTMTIELGGHTDNVGADDVNFRLSQDRATTVRNYLISKGVEATRVTAKGYGEAKPVVANDTDENRQSNRRVEFIILKK